MSLRLLTSLSDFIRTTLLPGKVVSFSVPLTAIRLQTLRLPAGISQRELAVEMAAMQEAGWFVDYVIARRERAQYSEVAVIAMREADLATYIDYVQASDIDVLSIHGPTDDKDKVVMVEVRVFKKQRVVRRCLIGILLAMLLLAVVGGIWALNAAARQRDVLAKQAQVAQRLAEEARQRQQQEAARAERQRQIKTLLAYRSSTQDLFYALSATAEDGICFTALSREKNAVLFSGQARSAVVFTEFLTHWQVADVFSEIKIEYLHKHPDNPYLEFRFEGVEKNTLPTTLSATLQTEEQERLIADIYTWAHLSGFSVQAVNQMPSQRLRVIGIGDYAQFSSFVYLLSGQPRLALMTDFSYQRVLHTKYKAQLDLQVWSGGMTPAMSITPLKSMTTLQNPFCVASVPSAPYPHNDLSALQSVSLNAMKMLGYMQQAERVYAIVGLPDGTVVDVAAGYVLGVERATVVFIQPDRVVLALPNKRQWTLRL